MTERPPKGDTQKLWQGRATGTVAAITVEMGESISLDIELYREDIYGSAHHARMLAAIGILSNEDVRAILDGLRAIRHEIEEGKLELRADLEDIHTHIENRLVELVGEPGRRLHTARSRNDQVALDTHLFVRRQARELGRIVLSVCAALEARATDSIDIVLPGYTHLQIGQPVRLSHHLLAHFWSFARDVDRFHLAARSADDLPLGSGAMAGVNYATDREFLRKEMHFAGIYPNSMDAVASRDHILNYLHACSVFMVHASRIAEEIILWNSQEFGFISLPDSLTTGSSIMPQKKNPDLAELVRGKVGRVLGHYQSLSVSLKGLPFAYNRDLQEDRFPLIDAGRQCSLAARALAAMTQEMEFHPERMRASLEKGFASATDLADALVHDRGIPFREAHHIAGRLTAFCAARGITFADVSAGDRLQVSEHLGDELFFRAAVDVLKSADKKISQGGTARVRQEEQLDLARARLAAMNGFEWPGTDLSLDGLEPLTRA